MTMPEFVLDTSLDAEGWKALPAFVQGYIEAAFFTSHEEVGESGFHDLAPEALEKIKEDCDDFQDLAGADLIEVYDQERINGYDENYAGGDFWYTRNGHGAGFWDRGFGDLRTDTLGGRLSRDAKSFGSQDLYLGDDGKVHVS